MQPTDSAIDSVFPELLSTAPPAGAPLVAREAACVSASVPDWARERRRWGEWAPAKSLIDSVRAYQRHAGRRGPLAFLGRRIAVLRHRFWSAVTGADLPPNARIDGGLVLPHPNGVVIHPGATIGPNCMIFQQVTIGTNRGGVPTIGGHVDIGAGAKVLGAIRIGDHARIGANAVVLCDVPAGATAVGVPAIVLGPRPVARPGEVEDCQ